jgi:hypothetical protein
MTTMTTPQALKARFAYMFQRNQRHLSFYRGWMPLLEQLCADINSTLGPDKHGFRWIQIKEKFGSGRFYDEFDERRVLDAGIVGPDGVQRLSLQLDHGSIGTQADEDNDDEVGPQIDPAVLALYRDIGALVRQATAATDGLCMLCGGPGRIDRREDYWLTLCAEHAPDRRRGQLAQLWMEEGP